MPQIKSAEKRDRQSIKRRAENRETRSKISTARAKVIAKPEAATVSEYASILDKAAKAGTIKKNTASRRKSRAAKAANKAAKNA